MTVPAGYLALIGAVIRSGMLKENQEYPLTAGGRFWCSLGNIHPEYLIRRANGLRV